MQSQNSHRLLVIIINILAAIVLVFGLVAGISLFSSAGNVDNVLLPLQLAGAGAFANMIGPLLTNLLVGIGVFVLLVAVVLSLMLFATGRLLGRITSLEARLARLEQGESTGRV